MGNMRDKKRDQAEVIILNRFPLYYVLLAHGKKRTNPRATALPWGLVFFSTKSKKHQTPPEWGVCGNQVPARTHR
jgi:hypothetical protein